MKKLLVIVLLLLSGFYLAGCSHGDNRNRAGLPQGEPQQTARDDLAAVTDLVEAFGGTLQLVSLQAPEDEVKRSIQENYRDYVTPQLLAQWLDDPATAPGRLVSSPWPDRIEIKNIDALGDDLYQVEGEIIEITSVEKVNGGAASKRAVTLVAKKTGGQWLVDAVTRGDYVADETIVYSNTEYGFSFALPDTWKGYQIVNNRWEGLAAGGQQDNKVVASGPLIAIRHPQWTSQDPRQDIPIMVFTLTQWEALQREEFHIGAAPVGPKELGRNSAFVFALPARYNYAFPTGYEEVEDILEGNPLRPE